MAIMAQPGKKFRVTIKKAVTRATALKTIERLFMMDKAVADPIAVRTDLFVAKPKRRGGRIWTKYPNKVHPELPEGTTATILATAQHARDLNSIADFVDVATV
jgi:hypothetical protein